MHFLHLSIHSLFKLASRGGSIAHSARGFKKQRCFLFLRLIRTRNLRLAHRRKFGLCYVSLCIFFVLPQPGLGNLQGQLAFTLLNVFVSIEFVYDFGIETILIV